MKQKIEKPKTKTNEDKVPMKLSDMFRSKKDFKT